MYNYKINKILIRNHSTRRHFIGCFPADKLPAYSFFKTATKFPICLVVNTDTANKPGEHWVAIYIEGANRVEYFDSLALWPPISVHILKLLSNFANVRTLNTPVQSPFATTCGYHVCYFLLQRCAGHSFQQIVERLYKLNNSDEYVRDTLSRAIFNHGIH